MSKGITLGQWCVIIFKSVWKFVEYFVFLFVVVVCVVVVLGCRYLCLMFYF